MKRDMDLIRTLLLLAEEECGTKPLTRFNIEGHEDSEIFYHIELLTQAGLVDGEASHNLNRNYSSGWIKSVTWEGHEYLDAIRDPTIWEKTKTQLGDSIGAVGLPIVLEVAKAFVKQKLGLE